MAQQFTGTVQILNNSSGSATVVLEGGDDESGGNLALGGNGQSGDLTLFDESSKQRIFASANASRPFLRLENQLGVSQVILEGDTGNIIIQGKLFFGGLGGIELSGTVVQTILQASQTINAFAQRILNLESREQRLTQQISSLEARVASLESKALTPPPTTHLPGTKPKITSVTFKDGKYLVTANGLKPNQLASVTVSDDALNVLIAGQQTASQSGTLDQFPVSVPCNSGLRMHFVVSSDLNNSDLTSESFTTMCQ